MYTHFSYAHKNPSSRDGAANRRIAGIREEMHGPKDQIGYSDSGAQISLRGFGVKYFATSQFPGI